MKEAKSLLKLGLVDRIILIGIHEKGFAEKEEIYPGIEIHRIKLLLKNSILKPIRYLSFLEFLCKAYFYTRTISCAIINVHSIHVLPIGVLMKRRSKCKLVYDAHELETEVTGAKGIIRLLSKFLERYCIQFIDEVIVVSDSIGKWYKNTYKISNITTIYNVPLRPELNTINKVGSSLRSTIGINKDKLLFIYQGLLTSARGVDELLDAFCGVG
ncbi:MAG: glycosyltransferase, partial [Bacteroidota bacterium]